MQQKITAQCGTTPMFTTIAEMYKAYRAWMIDDEGYSEFKVPIRKYFVSDLKTIGIEDYLIKINGEVIRGLYLVKLKSQVTENPFLR